MAGPKSGNSGDPQDSIEANILVIEARYYDDVGQELMDGAVAELEAHGCTYEVVSVPGALEIPQVLSQAAKNGLFDTLTYDQVYDGAIVLGCVIRGETSHYDIVCNNTNHSLMETVNIHSIPLGNAVLTVDTHDQAMARANGGRKGKGGDAVRACLRVIEVARKFDEIGLAAMDEMDDFVELDDLDLEALEAALEKEGYGDTEDDLELNPKAKTNGNGKGPHS